MKETSFINGFSEKVMFRSNRPNQTRKMTCLHNSGSSLSIFLKLLHSERGQEVHENYVNGFSEKILLGSNEPIWTRKW